MQAERFVVGIDLGTTHTVVAYREIAGGGGARVFPVPQLVTATEVTRRG
jgi:molecular chaperone DnaK (HSP70)